MKRQNNTSQSKGVARALIPFTQKINEINNINFSSIDFFFSTASAFEICGSGKLTRKVSNFELLTEVRRST